MSVCYAPGHARGVVSDAVPAVRGEQNDAAVAAQAGVEVIDGGLRGIRGRGPAGYLVNGPLAEDEFHDGFAPAGERGGSAVVVGVAAAADERRVADTAWRFVEGAAGGCGAGEVAMLVQSNGADGVMGVKRW